MLFLRRRRHARCLLRDRLHRWERRWVVSSLRWVVSRGRAGLVDAAELRRTAVRWSAHLSGRRRTVHLHLLEARSVLFRSRLLRRASIRVILPLAQALWSSTARSVFSLAGSSISRRLSCRWRWRTARDAGSCWVCVMLVWRARILCTTRRWRRVADKRTDLRRAVRAAERRHCVRLRARCRHAVRWWSWWAVRRLRRIRWPRWAFRMLSWSHARVRRHALMWVLWTAWVWCRSRLLHLRRRRQTSVRWGWRSLWLLLVLPWRRRALRLLWWWLLALLLRRRLLLGWLLLRRQSLTLVIRVHWLWLHLGILQIGESVSTPVVAGSERWWCRTWRRWVLRVGSPLRAWRTSTKRTWLVGLRVHVLW